MSTIAILTAGTITTTQAVARDFGAELQRRSRTEVTRVGHGRKANEKQQARVALIAEAMGAECVSTADLTSGDLNALVIIRSKRTELPKAAALAARWTYDRGKAVLIATLTKSGYEIDRIDVKS
jgi:hypothetical protein